MPTKLFIPPGGFAGAAQQTVAAQMNMGMRKKRSKKRARRTAAATSRTTRKRTTKKRPAKRAKKKPARLVKGSAAAKRHMAKLRAMKKR